MCYTFNLADRHAGQNRQSCQRRSMIRSWRRSKCREKKFYRFLAECLREIVDLARLLIIH